MEEVVQTHNFKPNVFGKTVFAKDFILAEADETYDLKLELFNLKDVKIETIALTRLLPNCWRWEEFKETKPVGVYQFSLSYTKGTTDRQFLKGLIPVIPVV